MMWLSTMLPTIDCCVDECVDEPAALTAQPPSATAAFAVGWSAFPPATARNTTPATAGTPTTARTARAGTHPPSVVTSTSHRPPEKVSHRWSGTVSVAVRPVVSSSETRVIIDRSTVRVPVLGASGANTSGREHRATVRFGTTCPTHQPCGTRNRAAAVAVMNTRARASRTDGGSFQRNGHHADSNAAITAAGPRRSPGRFDRSPSRAGLCTGPGRHGISCRG